MLLLQKTLRTVTAISLQPQKQTKQIWGYVAIAFNRVDTDRLQQVGPDRLCTEWLLKNGGGVRLVGMPGKLLRDYNSLPPESTKFYVKEVDASNSSVMKIGFDHFRGCQHIDTVILHNCKHLEEDGLQGLLHLKETLRKLQVSGCYNITDEGLKVIGELKNLRELKIFDMKYVKDIEAVARELKKELPQCHIEAEK